MTAIRSLVQISLLAACAATSFVSAQVYVAAKADAQQEVAAKSDAPVVLADNGDRTKALSPIFPTTKYNLPPPPASMAKKPAKTVAAARVAKPSVKPAAKVAARPAAGKPMELAAYTSPQPVTYGYAPEAPQPRAAGIFGSIR
jgi:hypothetical protein